MFGGARATSERSNTSKFLMQLKALDAEERKAHSYNVWEHWIARKHTHPELYEVATVVLAAPSSQASVERAFSALALVLTDLRTALNDSTLANILIIKLNKDLYQKVLPGLYNWKQETDETQELPSTSGHSH